MTHHVYKPGDPEDRRRQVLDVLDMFGREAYSREIAERIDGDHLRSTVPWVQRVLAELAVEGMLESRLVKPGPDTFKGGMMRRYFRRSK